jgi:hypothetical protein
MSVLLVGSNPGLLLQVDDTATAFVSVWRVDWSTHGPGSAVVLWHDARTRVITERPHLGRWLADAFTRHFPEVDGLPWPEPRVTTAPVTMHLDPEHGLLAEADDVRVEITGPMDRRPVELPTFPGNGRRLTNVYTPCRAGTLRLADRPVPGVPRVVTHPRASSTAFLADAEVWCD